MGVAVVVLLGGLWASILVPAALRTRRETSPIHSVDLFERSMGMLAPKTSGGPANVPGRYVMVFDRPVRMAGPAGRSTALERRRAILLRLVAAVPATGVLALTAGGIFTLLFAASVIALVAYVGLLVQIRARQLEATAKLRHLPARHAEGAAPVQRRARAVGDTRF